MKKLLRVIVVGATLALAGMAGTWTGGDPPHSAADPAADAQSRTLVVRLASMLP